MLYREERTDANHYKSTYLDGLNSLIEKLQGDARLQRDEYIRDIFMRPEDFRHDLKAMFGWPLVGYSCTKLPEVTCEKLSHEDGFTLYRMQFQILECVTMTGLFFKADGNDKKPLIIAQHGGQGTPELICGVYGKTDNYHDMIQQVRNQNMHLFAPQLLLWADAYQISFDRKVMDARLKRLGSSITAVEVYGITRILDWFEKQDYVKNFGMVGLSYGGFYTLVTAAVDPRIQSAISCSFFASRDAYPWCDWTWQNSAMHFDDAEIACLVYPRKLYLAIGTQDCMFDYIHSEASFQRICQLCGSVGTDWVTFETFTGDHEFLPNPDAVAQMLNYLK